MNQDGDEKHGVEVRNNGGSADAGAPCKAHNPVRNVIGFARVRPPSACQ